MRDLLAPIAAGDHRRADTNGILRLGALDLEVLGARYAQTADNLEHAALAYQQAATATDEPVSRVRAARIHPAPRPAPGTPPEATPGTAPARGATRGRRA